MTDEIMKTPESEVILNAGKDLGSKLGIQNVQTGNDSSTPIVIAPEGYEVTHLQHLLPPELRVKEAIDRDPKFLEIASWIAYVNRNKDGNTQVFASSDNCTIKAIFDYPAPNQTHETCFIHNAEFQLAITPIAKEWLDIHKKWMSQEIFAEFLLERGRDVISTDERPATSADIYEVARFLQATKNTRMENASNLHNGAIHVVCTEEISAKIGTTDTEVPQEFNINIELFPGQPRVNVTAHLRYRFDHGELSFMVKLLELETIQREAFKAIVADAEAATEITIYHGCA